jgi:1,4-alpha-glucan branching enzyme
LWRSDYDPEGFQWVDCADHEQSVLSFLRRDAAGGTALVAILNLTPVPRLRYRVGLPLPGPWREVLNSDASAYGGSNVGNLGGVTAEPRPWHGQPCSAELTLPPLSAIAFAPVPEAPPT